MVGKYVESLVFPELQGCSALAAVLKQAAEVWQSYADLSQTRRDCRNKQAYTGPGNCRYQDNVSSSDAGPDALRSHQLMMNR